MIKKAFFVHSNLTVGSLSLSLLLVFLGEIQCCCLMSHRERRGLSNTYFKARTILKSNVKKVNNTLLFYRAPNASPAPASVSEYFDGNRKTPLTMSRRIFTTTRLFTAPYILLFLFDRWTRAQSRERTRRQRKMADKVGNGTSTREHFHQAFNALMNARYHKIAVCNIFY